MRKSSLIALAFYVLAFLIAFPPTAEASGVVFTEAADAGPPNAATLTRKALEAGAPLGTIEGTLGGDDTVDSYCIIVTNPGTFVATTDPLALSGASADFDTRLSLWHAPGPFPVLANDDTPFAHGGLGSYLSDPNEFPGPAVDFPEDVLPGFRYVLSISSFPLDGQDTGGHPLFDLDANFNALVGPNPAAGTYDSWEGGPAVGGDYRIRLEGAETCAHPKIFVTTDRGTGDLSTWFSADGFSGLAAADSVCRTLAGIHDSVTANRFVAWMSDSQDDAYCRAMGFSGKVDDNCGMSQLPVGFGPYTFFDGQVVGHRLDQMLSPTGAILRPIDRDETGHPFNGEFWTGTDRQGKASGQRCSDWGSSSLSDSGDGGHTDAGTDLWTEGTSADCSQQQSLVCIEAAYGIPATVPTGERHAFLTSVGGTGNLASWSQAGGQTGLAAGDAICQQLAADAALPHASTYKAWLSTPTVDALDRFENPGPWHRLDGTRIARSMADLIDGKLEAPLNVDETGQYRSSNTTVMTGTFETGTATGVDCGGWTSDSDLVDSHRGAVVWSNMFWTNVLEFSCDQPSQIYCFSDRKIDLFSDGFESGDTSGWSSSTGSF